MGVKLAHPVLAHKISHVLLPSGVTLDAWALKECRLKRSLLLNEFFCV